MLSYIYSSPSYVGSAWGGSGGLSQEKRVFDRLSGTWRFFRFWAPPPDLMGI